MITLIIAAIATYLAIGVILGLIWREEFGA